MKNYTVEEFTELMQSNFALNKENVKNLIRNNHLAENILLLGDSYHYIINFSNMTVPYISRNVQKIVGYDIKEWETGFKHNFKVYHPEDLNTAKYIHKDIIKFNAKLKPEERTKYRYSHDFRLRRPTGGWIRILHHHVFLNFDENGSPIYTFCVGTDITHIKKTIDMSLLISKYNEKTKSYDFVSQKTYIGNPNLYLTKRQIQILQLIVEGKTNAHIAEILNITENTVKTHRKKMLSRNNSKNISQLIYTAYSYGML